MLIANTHKKPTTLPPLLCDPSLNTIFPPESETEPSRKKMEKRTKKKKVQEQSGLAGRIKGSGREGVEEGGGGLEWNSQQK